MTVSGTFVTPRSALERGSWRAEEHPAPTRFGRLVNDCEAENTTDTSRTTQLRTGAVLGDMDGAVGNATQRPEMLAYPGAAGDR
jgi:hypothetical protein